MKAGVVVRRGMWGGVFRQAGCMSEWVWVWVFVRVWV